MTASQPGFRANSERICYPNSAANFMPSALAARTAAAPTLLEAPPPAPGPAASAGALELPALVTAAYRNPLGHRRTLGGARQTP